MTRCCLPSEGTWVWAWGPPAHPSGRPQAPTGTTWSLSPVSCRPRGGSVNTPRAASPGGTDQAPLRTLLDRRPRCRRQARGYCPDLVPAHAMITGLQDTLALPRLPSQPTCGRSLQQPRGPGPGSKAVTDDHAAPSPADGGRYWLLTVFAGAPGPAVLPLTRRASPRPDSPLHLRPAPSLPHP